LLVRSAAPLAALGLALCLGSAGSATAASPSIATYPSTQSIAATGALPRSAGELRFRTAIGERESAFVVARDARTVAVSVADAPEGVGVRLFFAHFVSVGGRPVPDVLEPWDGGERATEKPNQPLLVQVDVPHGARPGTYSGAVTVTADGRQTRVPLRLTVFPVTIPRLGAGAGSLLTAFNVSPESYLGKAAELFGFENQQQRIAANRALFSFLGNYRISPGSWGFGEPRGPAGYESSSRWWRDSAGNFLSQLRSSPGFPALRIPVSSNRTSARNYIARLSPFEPETWCGYLGNVRDFWARNGVLGADSIPYLFGYDEPSPAGQRVVARQASTLHRCFPGGRLLMTGNPSPANRFLWDNRGNDDLDIWTVLSRRYYGVWTGPVDRRAGKTRSRVYLSSIERVRARGRMVWSYTYTGTPGTPGLAATEPLSNPRMLMLWAALEGIDGVLYTQGLTRYGQQNPLESIGTGEAVLLYPGRSGPLPSARLEQIRDGIEDWAILDVVRKRHGADDVRALLGRAGLFSTTRGGTRLACNMGCELTSSTKYAWPRWSRDSSTPRRIEAAKLAALQLAG
jgi:hypothetical protein